MNTFILLQYAAKIVSYVEIDVLHSYVIYMSNYYVFFILDAATNATNLKAAIQLYTTSLNLVIKNLSLSDMHLVVLFLGYLLQFWNESPLCLLKVCIFLHRLMTTLDSPQKYPNCKDKEEIVNQVLILVCRILDYVKNRHLLVIKMNHYDSQVLEQRNNVYRDYASLQFPEPPVENGIRYTRSGSFFEIGDELVLEQYTDLLQLVSSCCQVLIYVCQYCVNIADVAVSEILVKISNCFSDVLSLDKLFINPGRKVLKAHNARLVSDRIQDIFLQLARCLEKLSRSQLHYVLNRIIDAYIRVIFEVPAVDNFLCRFTVLSTQGLIQSFILNAVSTRLDVWTFVVF